MRPTLLIVKVMIVCCGIASHAAAQRILVRPYIQPGNASDLKKELKVLIWQTDSVPGNFVTTYYLAGQADKVVAVKSSAVQLNLKHKTTYLYRAVLSQLQFDTLYYYEVRMNNSVIARDSFRTRTQSPLPGLLCWEILDQEVHSKLPLPIAWRSRSRSLW